MTENGHALVPSAGMSLQRTALGDTAIANTGEVGVSALQAHATAEIQAGYIMALQRPRSVDDFRVRLLDDCKRPAFAACAMWTRDVGSGNKLTDVSIRFVEAALQRFGNVRTTAVVLADNPDYRVVRVTVLDLETNTAHNADVSVPKEIDRYSADGREVIRSRARGRGTLFTVRPTAEELRALQNSLVSKTLRVVGLRILPRDIVDECRAAIGATLERDSKENPDATRRALTDNFNELGVSPRQLEEYLGHGLAGASPAELAQLRLIYTSLRNGQCKWTDVVQLAAIERGDAEEPKKPAKGVAALRDVFAADAKKHAAREQHGKAVDALVVKLGEFDLGPADALEFTTRDVADLTPLDVAELGAALALLASNKATWPEALEWSYARRGAGERPAEPSDGYLAIEKAMARAAKPARGRK